MVRLRAKKGITALALEFTILTAVRTGEAIGATFDEFDLAAKVWRIPGERM
jgi:integrase